MVLEFNSSSSADSQSLIEFGEGLLALFANMAQIHFGDFSIVKSPVFGIISIGIHVDVDVELSFMLLHFFTVDNEKIINNKVTHQIITMKAGEEQLALEQRFSQDPQNRTFEGFQLREPGNRHEKYGNMRVLAEKPWLISVGPDCIRLFISDCCFTVAFASFLILSIVFITFLFINSNWVWMEIMGVAVCGGLCVSYFAVAMSDPGIVVEEEIRAEMQEEENPMSRHCEEPKKLCRRCNILVKRGTFHCIECDVCIEGYDHHCPWTSKCIGRGNIILFYIFLIFVPFYLVYMAIAFALIMTKLNGE